jgi:mannose-6-phosphate isomerase-like protein (cupin superfamily)
MNPLFIKILRGKRISPEDQEMIGSSLELISNALRKNYIPDANSLTSTAGILYIYALGSDEQRTEVLSFADWFKNPDPDTEFCFSDGLLSIVSTFFADLQIKRIGELLERINLQKSLTIAKNQGELVSSLTDNALQNLYQNKVDALNIDFTVSVLPFQMEVLDPRIVTVQPGKANEMHRHAHETVFIFLKGNGKVIVDNFENDVKPGDFAFIPRWCNHQTLNISNEELVFLAVADFGLTGKSFLGNYMKTARMKTV